jgi:histone acetyltransferase (RNA polymerase elongator complex component)
LADGIRFSTRPDTIDHPRLDLIRKFPVATIELGVQSMDDHVLALSGRGHSRADSIGAVQLLKANNYEVGVQLMVGLPGDTPAVALETARQVRDLKPDFVRIYPTVVLAGSLLARWYQNGRYIPLSLEDAVHQVKDLYLLFKNSGIRIIRMGLQASKDLENGSSILAGPYHPAFGHLVYSEIFLTAVQSVLTRAQFSKDRISIRVHPVSVSKMRGLNNSNLDKLKRAFGLKSVAIGADSALANDLVRLNDDPPFSIYPNYRIFPA